MSPQALPTTEPDGLTSELQLLLPSSTRSEREALAVTAGLGWPELWAAWPPLLLTDAGLTPDEWQADALASEDPRVLMLCSRQAGKSTVAAALALREAVLTPRSLVLLLSPTLRQSGELFRDKLLSLWSALGSPLRRRPPTALTLELANGSRVVSLPENEAGIRGFSGVGLLVIDEAARVADSLYKAVRPMLAVSGGRLVALSTPFGQRGWFYEEWENGGPGWRRFRVRAQDCPRISPEFLEDERRALGDRWFNQEYMTSFEAVEGAFFDPAVIDAAFRPLGGEQFGSFFGE
jgi:hypothetical protein